MGTNTLPVNNNPRKYIYMTWGILSNDFPMM